MYKFQYTVAQPMAVDSNSLMASQAPPEMLLGSEESEKKHSPIPAEPGTLLDASETMQSTEKTNDSGETITKGDPVDKTPPQSSQEALPGTIDSSVVWNLKLCSLFVGSNLCYVYSSHIHVLLYNS